MLRLTTSHLVLALGLVLRTQQASAFTVPIRDTDDLREVCSGMWGGKEAHIEVSFDPSSSGQVALVVYEWGDVSYLGVDTPEDSVGGIDRPKTYICTSSAIRQGLCTSAQSGSFITSLPSDKPLDSTSIFTQALRFGDFTPQSGSFNGNFESPSDNTYESEPEPEPIQANADDPTEDQDQNQENSADGDDGGEGWDSVDLTDGQDGPDDGKTYEDPDYIPEAPAEANEEDAPEQQGQQSDEGVNEDDGEHEGEDDEEDKEDEVEEESSDSGWGWWRLSKRDRRRKRQFGVIGDIGDALKGLTGSGDNDDDYESMVPTSAQEDDETEGEDEGDEDWNDGDAIPEQGDQGGQDDQDGFDPGQEDQDPDQDQPDVEVGGGVKTYTGPITYQVKKTGYYCIGVVPVTLVNSRDVTLAPRQVDATHAEYSGSVFFRNTFDGELPAVEYPKINFYLALSVVYFVIGCTWAFLCIKYRNELLPMQYYISGTIVFLIIEMLANFAYYRYINKHGGGAGSLAFLFVVSVLNAARNSLSFFLLLIVCMGLSVVTQNLGSVMNKIRILTGFHFVFGVLYSVGTVEVELDSASLAIILILIFPLALTLTAFLMWIIVSLNGTILHLRAQKQRYKLHKFQTLWRILIVAVIAVAVFFVLSSMSLSNRLDEDYAPKNWRWRWILLDGSLSTIYLCVFAAIAWLWRPTRDNVRFSMSQELAQDEAEADAEDYEFAELENGRTRGMNHQPLPTDDDDFEGSLDEDARSLKSAKVRGLGASGGKGGVKDENVVFAMGEDSDDEGEDGDGDDETRPMAGGGASSHGGKDERGSPPEYRDASPAGSEGGVGAGTSGKRSKGDKDD